jgi:hypothetical protein
MPRKQTKITPPPEKRSRSIQPEQSSFYGRRPSWSFSRCHFDHPRWGLEKHSGKLLAIIQFFSGLEGQRWGDVLTSTAGRGGNTRNHMIPTDRFSNDIQEMIMDRKLHVFDNLYSLAMSNMERLYGVIIDGVFFLVWYDPKHEIYPVGKRHA